MLGKRGPQRGLFEADTAYGAFVGRDSFYGWLASQRGELFRDEQFAGLYVLDNGRPSVPPSLLAVALVLQTYDGVSDDEAKQRADYDLRWKVALGVELDARPFAKSTLQEFRAQLIVHQEQAAIFQQSLELAKRRGKFRTKTGEKRKLKVALDTTNILGRGAVKDTYNLLGDGIVKLARVLAKLSGQALGAWAEEQGYSRYVGPTSLKGTAEIDWSDAEQRRRFLGEIVSDADRLLEQARVVRTGLEAGSAAEATLLEAAGLLSRVLVQDVERREDGPAIKQGVAKDRLLSVHDPEMRHGRKSASKRFDGYKAAVAVDTDEPLITAVTVLAGNAPDAEGALELIEQTEATTGCAVDETMGDCAYGSGETRQAFAAVGRTIVAKVPSASNQGCFPKTAFVLDLEATSATCPAGQTTQDFTPSPTGGGQFRFDGVGLRRLPAPCPMRPWVQRPDGRRASPGTTAAGSPRVAGQPGLHGVSAPTPDGRAPHRPPGSVGYPPGPRRRHAQDPVPVAHGRRRGQPDLPRRLRHPDLRPGFGCPWAPCRTPGAAPRRPEPPAGPQMARRGSRRPQSRPSVVTPSTAHGAADRVHQPRFSAGLLEQGLSKSTDGGASWSPLTIAGFKEAEGKVFVGRLSVSRADHQLLYGVALLRTDSGVVRSHDGGLTWELAMLESPMTTSCRSWTIVVLPHDSDRDRAVRVSGCSVVGNDIANVSESSDQGTTWEFRGTPTLPGHVSDIEELVGFRGAMPDRLYALTMHSDRVGYRQNSPPLGRAVFRSDDVGRTWTEILSTVKPDQTEPAPLLTAITFDPDNPDVVCVAMGSKVQYSQSGGSSWRTIGRRELSPISALAVDAKWPYLYAATDDGIFYLNLPV